MTDLERLREEILQHVKARANSFAIDGSEALLNGGVPGLTQSLAVYLDSQAVHLIFEAPLEPIEIVPLPVRIDLFQTAASELLTVAKLIQADQLEDSIVPIVPPYPLS